MNHKHAWDLIPWLVNGSIAEPKRESLQRHLAECPACREEVAAQRELLQAMKTRPQVESMPHGSLQKLWSRIDASPEPLRETVAVPRSPRVLRWLTAAVVLQALLLGLLATLLLRSPGAADRALYQTVSAPATAAGAPSVRAVFSPDMTLGELQALLERARLRIVNGPSPEGVYTLATATPADDPRQALLTLRAHPAARFAEPIGR
jgi:anti-sigma factor RsiW